VPEDGGAVFVGVAQYDAEPAPRQQLRQPLLTVAERQAAKVLTVERQEVEGIQQWLRSRRLGAEGI
jgi:hypothetical protein